MPLLCIVKIKHKFKTVARYFVLIILCIAFVRYLVNTLYDKTSRPIDRLNENISEKSFNFSRTFNEALLGQADVNRTIVMSVFDTSYADMAYNLYESSVARFNITNYLFVGADGTACQQLNRYHQQSGSVVCATRFYDAYGATISVYGSQEFRRKTRYKTIAILDALYIGLSVLIVDVDIVFMSNPLPEFAQCLKYDLQMQLDYGIPFAGDPGNVGFYFVRPTNVAINLLRESLVVQAETGWREQQAFNTVLRKIQKQNPESIRFKYLDKIRYPVGPRFYENNFIMYMKYVDKCKNSVIVHNNWMQSKEAKIYRFKETGMWHVDRDQSVVTEKGALIGGYYSDPKHLYLTYENTQDFGPGETLRRETNALKTALYIGYLLNRTVILPAFHCYGCAFYNKDFKSNASKLCANYNRCFDRGACLKFLRVKRQSTNNYNESDFSFEKIKNKANRCSLNNYYNITQFNSQFAYREHIFLQHPKVPDIIKQRHSVPMLIAPKELTDLQRQVEPNNVFSPSNFTSGATSSEIRSWFSSHSDWPVLRFHSLYDVISDRTFLLGSNGGENKYVFARIQAAFTTCVYRQNRSN